MSNVIAGGSGLIFMKIGVHAREPVEEIIERKRREYESAGMIFWGYGGNTCHPVNFVQPFARNFMDRGMPVRMVMHKMTSNHYAEPKLAEEYSDDGINWRPIPTGIRVKGSRYAMVIGPLEEESFDLDLRNLTVAIGAKRGASGVDYIRGRVDKGCFEYQEERTTAAEEKAAHIDLSAALVSPFAVFLR